MSPPIPYRRATTPQGRRMAGARALWRATGMKTEDFSKPIVAIANSFTQFVPGHVHLHPVGQQVDVVRQRIDDRHLLLPDVRGNRLFQSYENIDASPQVGLIFFIPGVEYTVRVNGTAQVVDEEDLKACGIPLRSLTRMTTLPSSRACSSRWRRPTHTVRGR